MPRRRFTRFVENAFQAGTLTWNSPVNDAKHIKATMGAQLAAFQINHLSDIILVATECANLLEVAKLFASLLTSPRLHECAATVPGGPANYLPRPFNRYAFNAMADILDYAVATRNTGQFAQFFGPAVRNRLRDFRNQHLADEPGSTFNYLVNEYNEHNRGNTGPQHPLVRAARSCPCHLTAGACNAAPECRWVPRSHHNPEAGCIARDLSNPDGTQRAAAHRRHVEDEFFNPDDAGMLEVEAGPMGPLVRAGNAGAFRKIHRRPTRVQPQRNRRATRAR